MPAIVHPHPFVIRPPTDLLTRFPHLRHNSHALALRYVYGPLVTEDDLQAMGTALWHALDIADAFDTARAEANPAILPLIIESDAADVQLLPWETLYHPAYGFLGKSPAFTLSRRTGTEKLPATPPEPGPLRVLLFTSLPNDVDPEHGRLNVEEEQAQVLEALAPWEAEGTVVLEMPNDGQFSTLQAILKDFRPHLVFLSGHGKFHHEPHQTEPPYGIFLFEDEAGDGDPVRDERLAQAFIGTGVQAVVLSACESGKAASTDLTHGLAAQLRGIGIPHVIGMRESVLDRAGILFARVLCDELVQQERVDVALQKARAAITRPLEGEFREAAKSTVVMDSSQLAELSLGQWCLPALQTATPEHPLITWDFQPQPRQANLTNDHLNNISLPSRFIGRRFDLREATRHLTQCHQLLITGPGGQGKTALAGKLAQDFQRRDYTILAWTARAENTWDGFVLSLLEQLTDPRKERYDKALQDGQTETEKATILLSLLLEQTDGKLILFFDNLESIQDPDTRALTNETVMAWIQGAQSLAEKGLYLLLTSRWLLPDWPERDYKTLARVNYGDFLAMTRQVNLPRRFLYQRDRLRQVYDTLHGNGRGLNFFVATVAGMESDEETAFLEKLIHAEAETQTDMALDVIISRLTPGTHTLLNRLPVYPVPVPLEGIVKIASDLPNVESLLHHLLAISLVERQYESTWQVFEYELPMLVLTWLVTHKTISVTEKTASMASDYQLFLFQQERRTLIQAQIVHAALRRAGKTHEADRFALDRIVGRLNMAGLYRTLLADWLPAICESPDPAVRAQAFNRSGLQHLGLGNFVQALSYFKDALALCRKIGDKAGEGRTLNNLSQIYDARGDYAAALGFLQQALAICREIGDKTGEGTTLNNLSQIFKARGDYATTLGFLQQALAIQREIGDKAGEGATLNNMATTALARGDYATALAYLQQALAICREIGDKAGEGATLDNMATTAHVRGDYETALGFLQQALAIQKEIGDKAGEGTTLNNLSQIYDARGDYTTALAFLQKSLAICREIGDKAGEGTTLNNLSQIYNARGDYAMALAYLQQALAICREIGDKAGEGRALNNMATTAHARGDYATALAFYQQVLVIMREIGDRAGEARMLNNISQIYDARGAYETALAYLQQALAIQREIGDKAEEGTTLNNLSQIFKARGDYATALAYLQKSLAICREIGDKAGEGRALNNLSQIFKARGDYATALAYLQQALAIRREIGDKAGEGATLNNLAGISRARGDYATALGFLQQALAIQKEIGDKAGEGATLNNMATTVLARGDYATALAYLQQALAIQKEIGYVAGLCATLFNIGHIHAQNNEIQEALRAWVTVYQLAKKINLAQVLEALVNLAPQLGMPKGLEGWEMLAQRMGDEE